MPMNREQRRKFFKTIRAQVNTSICPKCGHTSLFYSTSRGPKDTVLKCKICDEIVREGPELTAIMPPGIYCPGTLDMLDAIIAQKKEELDVQLSETKEKNETITGDSGVDINT